MFKITWKDEDYKNLNYEFKPTYLKEGFEKYSDKTYEHSIGNHIYFLPNPMPEIVKETLDNNYFNKYSIKSAGLHLIKPGMFLPLHKDLYKGFKKAYNIDDFDITKVHRYIIFLEDSKSGHLLQIKNEVVAKWYAGGYLKWTGSELHAAYNLGTENRYTLQVTCYV